MKGAGSLVGRDEFDKQCLASKRAAMDLFEKHCGKDTDTTELEEKLEKEYVTFWNQFVLSLAVNVGTVIHSSQ